jgi:hypothetical protein
LSSPSPQREAARDDRPHGPLPGVSGGGRITPVSDWTCILDRAGEAPGYVLTRRARARVVAAAGEATM